VERIDHILELEVAAWTEEVESGLYDWEVGFEAGEEGAAVDVVELVGEVPGVFAVVDFEVAVGWDAGLLARLQDCGGSEDALQRLHGA
jgi:hypothetical protein